MHRPFAWLAGAAGGAAVYRLLRRRGTAPALSPPAGAGPDPRAEELRARLDAARQAPVPESPPTPPPEERRRDVHERGRAALDEMQGE